MLGDEQKGDRERRVRGCERVPRESAAALESGDQRTTREFGRALQELTESLIISVIGRCRAASGGRRGPVKEGEKREGGRGGSV